MQLGGGVDFYVLLFGVVCLAWCDFAMNLSGGEGDDGGQ
jgi:hypothetical protein